MPANKILHKYAFYALSGLSPKNIYESDGVPPIVFKNRASVLTPNLVKLF